MDDIDGREMNVASKSASSGRRKFPIAFFLKKLIDFKILGPPNGSKAFQAMWGPAGQWLYPDNGVLLGAECPNLENDKKH